MNAVNGHGEIGEPSDSDYFQEKLKVKIQKKASLKVRNKYKILGQFKVISNNFC